MPAYLAKFEASGLKPSEFFRECVLQNMAHLFAGPFSNRLFCYILMPSLTLLFVLHARNLR